MSKFYRKDWILFEEVASEGGKMPADLKQMEEKKDDPEKNKHVPYITETETGYEIKCGKNGFHDMTSDHHIMFIDLYVDDKFQYRQHLKYGNNPEEPMATFNVPKGKKVWGLSFCNLHGLWYHGIK